MGTPRSSRRKNARLSAKGNSSKDFSMVQKKKQSKRRKKKSRQKSVSLSHSREYDSTSSMSCSCSSCKGNYRSPRRSRKIRKKVFTSSSSEGRSNGFFRDLKRKKPLRNARRDTRRKTSKKKSRRDDGTSCESSSFSCSTCCSGHSSSESDSASEMSERKYSSMGRKRINGEKAGGEYSQDRYRPESCSLSSKLSDHADGRKEEVVVQNNSRRLKSIVIVPENSASQLIRPFEKSDEETTSDHDDYTCRSRDSNDGENKKNAAFYLSEKGTLVEDVNVETTKCSDENGNHHDRGLSHNTEISTASESTGVDLEVILRQKALENLRKFKGVCPVDINISGHSKNDNKNKYKMSMKRNDKELDEAVNTGEDSVLPRGADATIPNTGVNVLKTLSSKQGKLNYFEDSKVSRRMNVTEATTTGASISNVLPLIVPNSSSQSFLVEHLVPGTSIQNDTHVSNSSSKYVNGASAVGSSVSVPASGNYSICKDSDVNQSQKKGGESSQFETKTMSVMRGGEMVQVSYKVYIPKKAPALARRQLQR